VPRLRAVVASQYTAADPFRDADHTIETLHGNHKRGLGFSWIGRIRTFEAASCPASFLSAWMSCGALDRQVLKTELAKVPGVALGNS
jgi:hypothetical protein